MFRLPAIFLLLLTGITAVAQHSIHGKVVNESTGAAIPGCSVFVTNTSRGTVSDNAGNFVLTDIPGGKHELVISSIGYETNTYSFTEAQLPLQLKIQLKVKLKEIENVVLEPYVEEGWDKWGKAFMDYFVGNTENASRCKIKNEKVIHFRYYKKSNRLVAIADEPLQLENKSLGYEITYQLENFELNYREGSVFYIGYSLYKEIEGERKGLMEKWKRNREAAYNGSVMHFVRSLYNNELAKEGFEVKRMKRVPNLEKLRVKELLAAKQKAMKADKNGVVVVTIHSPADDKPGDSTGYYNEVMHQPDYKEVYGRNLLTADSLVVQVEGENKLIHFDDYIAITYTKEQEEKAYADMQFPPRKPTLQRSTVTLRGDKLIAIDQYGNYYDPADFFTSGYWGWCDKMGDSLPFEYEPPQQNASSK